MKTIMKKDGTLYRTPFINEPTEDEKCEDCVLCGGSWWSHEGWLCPQKPSSTYYANVRFDVTKIPREYRFWTQSMYDLAKQGKYSQLTSHIHHKPHILSPTLEVPVVEDIPEWRKWQHNAPGECPCGIVRSRCDYHR